MATTNVVGFTLTLAPPILTILRLAPLVGSTASITHAYMELITTSAFLRPVRTTSTWSVGVQPHSPTPSQATSYSERVEAASATAIPAWFTTFFNTGVWSVIGLNFLSTGSALVNLLLFKEGLGDVGRKWYWVGFVSAAAHMAFIPAVMGPVAEIIKMAMAQEIGGQKEEERKGRAESEKANRQLKKWVSVHRIRLVTVDVAAWVAFAFGAVNVLTAR